MSSRPHADVPLPSSFDDNPEFFEENRWQKLSRRLREEPLVPIGCALTVAALIGASRAMRRGDHETTNMMFRRRIYAQGFTLLAVLAGSLYWQRDREKRKEFEGVLAEKKRREKHDAWIRELEAREEEDRAWRSKLEKMKKDKEASEADSALESSERRGLGIVEAVRELVESSR